MSRRSMAERMRSIESRGDELAQLPVSASPVHIATIDVMTELMSLGEKFSGAETPAYLKAMFRTLTRARPMLIEQVAQIPPAQIREFMADLVTRMQKIVDSEDGGAGDRYAEIGVELDAPGPLADLA